MIMINEEEKNISLLKLDSHENYTENLRAITRNFAQIRVVMRNCALIFGVTFPSLISFFYVQIIFEIRP